MMIACLFSKLRLDTIWTLLLLFWATKIVAQTCVPSPLALPIKNVTLSTGKTQRGVLLTVAEPEQSFAFLPCW